MIDYDDRSEHALRQVKSRQLTKKWTIPIILGVVGLALHVLTGFAPIEAIIDVGAWLTLAVDGVNDWLRSEPLVGLISAPLLGVVAGLAIVRIPYVSGLLDRVFPDPPAFVFSDLELERNVTMIALERSPLELIGRQDELNELEEMLDDKEASFQWRSVTGVSGIGKSRLAIEWLALAEQSGWDFGVLDPENWSQIRTWRPRKKTAFVIDEARTVWRDSLDPALIALAKVSSRDAPVRVLVVSQLEPFIAGAAPEQVASSMISPPLNLSPLSDEAMREIALDIDDVERASLILRESGGRPRAALILANAEDAQNYRQAIDAWVYRALPGLRAIDFVPTESVSVAVLSAALCGPIGRHDFAEYFPEVQLTEAASVLQNADSSIDSPHEIPAIVPDDLAQGLVLHLLWRIAPALRSKVLDFALLHRPERVETILHGLWQTTIQLGDLKNRDDPAIIAIRDLQSRVDTEFPQVRAERRARLSQRLSEISDSNSIDDISLDELELIDRDIRARPYDIDLAAKASTTASTHFARILQNRPGPASKEEIEKRAQATEIFFDWVERWHTILGQLDCYHLDLARAARSYARTAVEEQKGEIDLLSAELAAAEGIITNSPWKTVEAALIAILNILVKVDYAAFGRADAHVLQEQVYRTATALTQRMHDAVVAGEFRNNAVYKAAFLDCALAFSRSGILALSRQRAVDKAFELKEGVAAELGKNKQFGAAAAWWAQSSFCLGLVCLCIECNFPERVDHLRSEYHSILQNRFVIRNEQFDRVSINWLQKIIHALGERGEFTELEEWSPLIDGILAANEGEQGKQLRYSAAHICTCALLHYSQFHQLGSQYASEWIARFERLIPEFIDDEPLQMKIENQLSVADPELARLVGHW